jgi:hypothetical protein
MTRARISMLNAFFFFFYDLRQCFTDTQFVLCNRRFKGETLILRFSGFFFFLRFLTIFIKVNHGNVPSCITSKIIPLAKTISTVNDAKIHVSNNTNNCRKAIKKKIENVLKNNCSYGNDFKHFRKQVNLTNKYIRRINNRINICHLKYVPHSQIYIFNF